VRGGNRGELESERDFNALSSPGSKPHPGMKSLNLAFFFAAGGFLFTRAKMSGGSRREGQGSAIRIMPGTSRTR
jgi:hypothetical protein